jgi:hypothetical protein
MNELRLDVVMKRIDVYGRLAFGGQCAAAMAMIAGPIVLVAAFIVPFVVWQDDVGTAMIWVVAGVAMGVGVTAGGLGVALFAWRWSGDWITEWPGYAVGFGIAAMADALLAYLYFRTDVPGLLALVITVAAAFGIGCLVAGHLGGMRLLPEQREQRLQRRSAAARRR